MTEELVTFETAKFLKEKGFDIACENVVREDKTRMNTLFRTNKNLPKTCYSLPTQAIVAKWLRETKNVHICIYNNACGYGYEISKADNGTHISNDLKDGPNNGGVWDTYEEALEAGIKEALSLIVV